MRRRWIALGIAGGLACFALGVAAARWMGSAPSGSPSAGAEAPRIFIDAGSIQLLDASLRLELPPDLDTGAP